MATSKDGKSTEPALTVGHFGSIEHQKQIGMDDYITREQVVKESMDIINKLPLSKRWPFEAADKYIAVYAGAAGLVCNSYLRRMLMIRSGMILSSIPMFLAPAVTIKLGWYVMVTTPVLAGDLPCSICGEMRGGLVNVGLGVLYPLLIALPLNTSLALKHRTVDLPKLSLAWRNWPKFSLFWTRKMRFFKVQFASLAVFQGVIGVFLAKNQMDVYSSELKTKYKKVEQNEL